MGDTQRSGAGAGEQFLDELKAYEGRSFGPPVLADDPVNVAMIRNWVEAMGETNPIHLDEEAAKASGRPGIVAPPTMLQVWKMRGLKAQGPREPSAQSELLELLDANGFTSVVATNTEEEYLRELVLGDHLTTSSTIEAVSERRRPGSAPATSSPR